MADLADAFVALPGGFGTLDELLEQLTWSQLGLHAKPIGLLDVEDFWRPLIALARHATDEGFVRESDLARDRGRRRARSAPRPPRAAGARGAPTSQVDESPGPWTPSHLFHSATLHQPLAKPSRGVRTARSHVHAVDEKFRCLTPDVCGRTGPRRRGVERRQRATRWRPVSSVTLAASSSSNAKPKTSASAWAAAGRRRRPTAPGRARVPSS